MVNLCKLSQLKQLFQLQMCLSLETQDVLEHALQIRPTEKPADEAVDILRAQETM